MEILKIKMPVYIQIYNKKKPTDLIFSLCVHDGTIRCIY